MLAFRDRRDWKQFHSRRNLAAALAVESGELQEPPAPLPKNATEEEKQKRQEYADLMGALGSKEQKERDPFELIQNIPMPHGRRYSRIRRKFPANVSQRYFLGYKPHPRTTIALPTRSLRSSIVRCRRLD